MSGHSAQKLATPSKASSADGVRLFRTQSAVSVPMSDFTPTPIRMQPKLTVNAPGDKYEQEADLLAEQVMRMTDPAPAISHFGESRQAAALHRKVIDHDGTKDPSKDDVAAHGPQNAPTDTSGTTATPSKIIVLVGGFFDSFINIFSTSPVKENLNLGKRDPSIEGIARRTFGADAIVQYYPWMNVFSDVVTEATSWIADQKAQFPNASVWVVGHSYGGETALDIANAAADDVDQIITLDPVSRIWDMPPETTQWLNVPVQGDSQGFPDDIATLGGKFGTVEGVANLPVGEGETALIRHQHAGAMFEQALDHIKNRENDEQQIPDPTDQPLEQLMRMPDPQVQRQCACGKSSTDGECSECKKKKQEASGSLQRMASSPIGGIAAPPIVNSVLSSSGSPLPTGTRSFMESRFGQDFSHVRIHTDTRAAESAAAVGARAYTVGHHIVFGENESSGRDQHLLAHELVHTIQQGTSSRALQRQEGNGRAPGSVPSAAMTVSMTGLRFEFAEGANLRRGRLSRQLFSVVLHRLVGAPQDESLISEVDRLFSGRDVTRLGGFETGARAGEEIDVSGKYFSLDVNVVERLIRFLRSKRLTVQLSDEQFEILLLGRVAQFAWRDFQEEARLVGQRLPAWYTEALFQAGMAHRGELLRTYKHALIRQEQGHPEGTLDRHRASGELYTSIIQGVDTLDLIRKDLTLSNDPKVGGVYRALWSTPSAVPLNRSVGSIPGRVRNEEIASRMLSYAETQPDLVINAIAYRDARVELLARFGRYEQDLAPSETNGDQQIADRPGLANRPPFPSTLSASPPLLPPLFEITRESERNFLTEVQFPTALDALGHWSYSWERIRIPDEQVGRAVDVSRMRGEAPTIGESASIRFGRDMRYSKTDIRRTIDRIALDIGPAGAAAVSLVGANAILRYLGTGLRLGIELLTTPRNVRSIGFATPGLYLVRSRVQQVLEGGEEVVRAPSVAYVPVLVRDAEELATQGVEGQARQQSEARNRIPQLERERDDPSTTSARKAEIEQELTALRAITGTLGDSLAFRRNQIRQYRMAVGAGQERGDLDAIRNQEQELDTLIANRGERDLAGANRLLATFSSDLGQTIPLQLEVADRPSANGQSTVFLSDLTTPKSGSTTGSGRTRDLAIQDALKDLLEGISGYGRGWLAYNLNGTQRLRIEASVGSVLMESVDNVTTALSVAALAAAPFTGGATLSLLVPLGIVGAAPSAYRVVERVQAGTFDLSLENAIDVVNVAGSMVGVGRVGAGSLRFLQLERGLLFVGFGADGVGGLLMGAHMLTEIHRIESLPQEERAAALMLVIGQAMISAGIAVGHTLAARAHSQRLQQSETPSRSSSESQPQSAEAHDAAAQRVRADIDQRFDTHAQRDLQALGVENHRETADVLNSRPELRQALVENSLAARVLKQCGSSCYPPNAQPHEVRQLDDILQRVQSSGGTIDEPRLRQFLHDRREFLSEVIHDLSIVGTQVELDAILTTYRQIGLGSPQGRTPTSGESEGTALRFFRSLLPSGNWEHKPLFLNGVRQRRRGKNPLGSTEPDAYSETLNVAVEVKTQVAAVEAPGIHSQLGVPTRGAPEGRHRRTPNQQSGRHGSLPPGTEQWLVVDFRGQNLSPASVVINARAVRHESSGVYARIYLITETGFTRVM